MPYNYLPHYSKKLVENPEISDHNKEVLDKFVQKMEGRGTKPGTINGYLSRFNTLAPKINFKLDEATQDDLEILASDINQDRVERQRGDGNFADKTKKKFFKALKCFYNQFIRKPGEGFNADLDGERLVGDISAQTKEEDDDDEDKVNLKKIPTPEQVRKVAAGSSLRDKCIILFCWGLGCRTGEVFKTDETHDYPEPLKWKDIQFKNREMAVTLRGKTGVRTIEPRMALPLMKKLSNQKDPDLEDPVFVQDQNTLYCPNCSDVRVKSKPEERNYNYEKRTYECSDCGWEGTHHDALKKKRPMDGDDARVMLRNRLSETHISDHISAKPTKFFRSARACYWAARGREEDFMRGWFGWAEDSGVPSKYKNLMRETVLKGVREDYGETLNEEEREFSQEYIQPFECENCGEWVSPMWNYCNEGCQKEIDPKLRAHNKPDTVLTETVDKVAEQSGANRLDGYNPREDAKTVAEFNEARHRAKNRVIKRVASESGIPETRIKNEMTQMMKEELGEVTK
jgi:predicted RNA-binding Zn-ribbon protein involved in translation (DUF1610 family)